MIRQIRIVSTRRQDGVKLSLLGASALVAVLTADAAPMVSALFAGMGFGVIATVAAHAVLMKLAKVVVIETEDRLVPLDGGETTLPWGKHTTPPVSQTLSRWARALGCPDRPEESHPKPGLKVLTYPPGRDGATFLAEFIEGQGHNWPGGQSLLPENMVGPRVDTLNATDVIWDFFRQHPRPE